MAGAELDEETLMRPDLEGFLSKYLVPNERLRQSLRRAVRLPMNSRERSD